MVLKVILLTGVTWFFFTALFVTPVVRDVVRLDCNVDVVDGRDTFPCDGRVDGAGFLSIVLGLLGIEPPALLGSLFKEVIEEAGLGPAELTDDLGLGLGDINGVEGLDEEGLSGPLQMKYVK